MKLAAIKILADENVSPKVVAYLRGIGIDVLDVKEQRWFGKEDVELLSTAYHEQRFVFCLGVLTICHDCSSSFYS